jgi:hypothetical protein
MSNVVVLTDAFTLINATNWSVQIKQVEIDATIVDLDTTAFGGSGWAARTGGIKDGTVKFQFLQDFTATTGLDAVMWPLFIAGVPVTFECRPTSAARALGNPAYTGSVLIKEWKPIVGKVGDLATTDVTFPTSGVVLRQTS